MKKRDRLHLRLSVGDAALLRSVARGMDLSISELVRQAAIAFALKSQRNVEAENPKTAATG